MATGPEGRDHQDIDPLFDPRARRFSGARSRRRSWCEDADTDVGLERSGTWGTVPPHGWRHDGRGPRGWWRVPRERGPLRRSREDRLLGGVAGGLSRRMGIDVTVVRIGLVLFGLASGFGLAVYVLGWLLLPQEGDSESIGTRAVGDLRGIALAIGLVPALAVALLVASVLHAGWLGSLAWPFFLSAAGLVLIWRNAADDERALIRRAAQPLIQLGVDSRRSLRALALRVVVGIALVAGGVLGLMLGHHDTLLRPLGGVVLVIAGFVIVFGPWWLSLARELVAERKARVRAEERADMAARIHDSVLQTLAMIQRSADQPQQVVHLARAQERELRSWLFEGRLPGSGGEEDATFAAAVRRTQREVEDAHGVAVDAVIVGDCPLDEELRVLLAAGREASVNAAKWSGAAVVSLFAEVEEGAASLFVRDRGKGFDPSAVAPDRRGLAESVRGRMARHGGSAVVRSAPGEGTDVELTMPRSPVGSDRRAAQR
jgi:signal transduction histidine kinase